MSSNRGYDSRGYGNSYNGGQATQNPEVVHKNDKTNDKRLSKENDSEADTLRVGLRPSGVSGSGLYGVDTASVKRDKASERLSYDDDNGILGYKASGSLNCNDDIAILRLSVQGFNFSWLGCSCWEDVEIFRAGPRKVAIQYLHIKNNPEDRKKGNSLVIDLDHVLLDPLYILPGQKRLQCKLQVHKNAKVYHYPLGFEAMQDVFKFQEVFTGFSVQTHIPDVNVHLRSLGPKNIWPTVYPRTIQLWRKVPAQHESFNLNTDAPHNQPHAWTAEEVKARSEYEGLSTETDAITASNMGLSLSNGSTMETPASSLLVLGGKNIRQGSHDGLRWSSIPLDGRVPSTNQCRCEKLEGSCKHITFSEEIDPTSYWRELSPPDPQRGSGAIEPSAIELSVSRSLLSLTATPSSLTTKSYTGTQKLKCVELEFRNIDDKMSFKAEYDALRRLAELDGFRRQNQPLLREEKLPSNYQSPRKQGSLTRKYESAAVDAGKMTSTVVQKGDNTEIMPFHKAKAEEGDSLAPLPQSPPALAGDSSSHISEPPDNLAFDGGKLNPNPDFYKRMRRSNLSDDRQQESIRPSLEGGLRQKGLLHRSRIDDYIRNEESSTIKSLISQSRLLEHSPPKYLESPALAAESLRTSERSDIWNNPGDEEQSFGSEKQVNRTPQRASIETSTKREQWKRRICRRIVVFMLWKREQEVCIPNELWSSPASFEFINVLEMSTLDKIKGFFETYSGREWNWWPFSAAAKPLESGKVRIRWQCACGDQRWTDASEYLTRKCQALVSENTTAGHERGNATSQSAGSVASHSQMKSVVPGSFPSDASQTPGDASNICSTAQASHIQNSSRNPSSKELYVLFCIYQKGQILHSQILATKCQNDEAFFDNLRQEYRLLKGFFRFWFSPMQFSHCDFVKFTRFNVNELAKVGHSLPSDLIYEYNPRPPGPHDDPPISPHEFRRRFYTPLGNPCGRSEALERIPKRQKRFQVNLHVDGREDMWGLLVELQPCFLVVLMWQIAITGGGWAFMGWWLSRHHGDLQDAAMPITLIITALMALWAPIGKGMRETL